MSADTIWKALSSAPRREIVDRLSRGPATTGALCAALRGHGRTAVLAHLAVLRAAGVVHQRPRGRERVNHLDLRPVARTVAPWVLAHAGRLAVSMVTSEKEARRRGDARPRTTAPAAERARVARAATKAARGPLGSRD
jgi:DNA-binding transcriptional ArsR family regulator